MDDGIRIVVIFMVVLAVGGVVVNISSNLLFKNSENLEKVGNRYTSEDKLIEKAGGFSEEEVLILAKQCYEKNYGIIFEDELCYILKSDVLIDVSSVSGDFISSSSGSSKTIYIGYVGSLSKVSISD